MKLPNIFSTSNVARLLIGVAAVLAAGWVFKYGADLPGVKQARDGYQGLF